MNAIAGFSCRFDTLPRVDDILSLFKTRLVPLAQSETVSLAQALDRVLAARPKALLNVPPADRSAMDGYAYRFGDAGPLRLAGSVLAGKPFSGAVHSGACVAIATGGVVPDGCDTVAMHEHCQVMPDGVAVRAKAAGANVRRLGEDVQAGAALLQTGMRIGARQIGLLAAAGIEMVEVRRPLRVALLSMGDELAGAAPDGIRDANRPMLHALCAANGFAVTDLGILPDNRARLADALAQAAACHDVILTTAGTSAGDEDHVRGAVMDAGGQLRIAGVAIKPGKPVSFGEIGRALVVALPGNSAAAYITFLVLALPLLGFLSGRAALPTPWQNIRAGFNHRKKPGMREYLRVRLMARQDGMLCAERCGGDGSAMLTSLADGDGLVMLAESESEIREGDLVSFAFFTALESA